MTQPTRLEYTGPGLDETDLPESPWPLLNDWLATAVARQESVGDLAEPLSMALATADADGMPDVREVLMKFLTPRGPGLVSHLGSAKGLQLAANPQAAGSLTWPALFRAVRFRGPAERVADDEVAAYHHVRPYGAQVSAWVSAQSEPIGSRAELEAQAAEVAARFTPEVGVPVPDDFVAWRIVPAVLEFWAGRPDRLHDRIQAVRVQPGGLDQPGAWRWQRLQP